jgi:folate-binding protein YgfZ
MIEIHDGLENINYYRDSMFIENYNANPMIDQLVKKFPDSSSTETNIKIFSNVKEEYAALKQGVGVLIFFNKTIIKLTGKDTLDFLHRVSTNSIKDLKPFYKVPTLFLNEKGRFIDRTILLNLENHFILLGNNKTGRLLNWVNKYIIMEDIQTSDISSNYCVFDLIGPQAESYLTLLIGDEIKSLNGENILVISIDEFNFNVFSLHENNGLKYYRILITSEQALNFADYIAENKSVFDLSFVGSDAFEIFRLEMGMSEYPSEINDNYNPHENGLINEISFTKGCYIGQEVIARLDTYDKVQRKITGLIFEDTFDSNLPIAIYSDGNEVVGEVTSVVNSIMLDKKIGLGMIRKKSISDEANLFVKLESNRVNLSVVELPFIK